MRRQGSVIETARDGSFCSVSLYFSRISMKPVQPAVDKVNLVLSLSLYSRSSVWTHGQAACPGS